MSGARHKRKCRRWSAGIAVLGLLLAASARADDVKIGLLFDSTGPIAVLVPPLVDAAKLAVDEVNANGGILKGQKLQSILADTKSTEQGAGEAANKLINADHVAAVVGALLSSTTIAAAHQVTIPASTVLISPSATATILTSLESNGFFFRVAPSDADQGWLLAKLVHGLGLSRVAVTYVNNDYGSGINDTFRDNFENYGGTVTVSLAHEANKNSYVQELQQLAQYDPEALVVITFAPSGGVTLIKEAIALGQFKQFIGTDSLMDPLLIKEVGADNLKEMSLIAPAVDQSTSAAQKFARMYSAAFKMSGDKIFAAQTYDAVMLTALAIEQAGSTDRTKIRDSMRQICCTPGDVIEPGDWAKAKADIAAGKKINYEGASGNCDFDEDGNVTGVYGHYIVENGSFKEVEQLNAQ